MEALGIIGLLVGIGVLILISYKGLHAVPTSLITGAVILIFNGINLWTGFSELWIGGMATVFTKYYLLFLASTLFANMMQATGACETIAYKFVEWFGKKHILTVIALLCFILCYGGVSFFVIMFAVGPIAFALFEELNIPRKLIIPATAAGNGAFVLAAPGSPQIQNVIPTELGTSLMAAPILGAIMTIAGTVLCIVCVEYIYKKEMRKVELGEAPGWNSLGNEATLSGKREKNAGLFGSFFPMIVIIGIIVVCSMAIDDIDATMLAVIAMCIGIIATIAFNFNCLEGAKGKLFKDWAANSAVGAANSALVLGAVVGFGSLVSGTDAFANIIKWLMGLDMSTYWKGVISTGTIAGICGSASSGEQLTMQYLSDYFINSGCNLDVLHRLIANASITFDALPHATGCFLMFSYYGVNHKIAYKYVFLLNVVIPVLVVLVATPICTALF